MSTDVDPEVYLTTKPHVSNNDSVMEKITDLEKKMALLADNDGQKSPEENKSTGKLSGNSRRKDEEWRKAQADKPCWNFERDGKCEYKNCAFRPCNSKPLNGAYFTMADF